MPRSKTTPLSRRQSATRIGRTSSVSSVASSTSAAPADNQADVKPPPKSAHSSRSYAATRGRATPSTRFFYKAGLILIKVEDTLYKLPLWRLRKHCKYFARRFGAENGWGPWVRGLVHAPVHEVTEVSRGDFEVFLEALEDLEHQDHLTQEVAVSLLRTSEVFSCEKIRNKARREICALWASEKPLSPDEPPKDTASALQMASLAREYDLPGVRKRAMYELLSSAEIRQKLAEAPESIALHHSDVYRLYRAQEALTKSWREYVVVPPGTDSEIGTAGCAPGADCDLPRIVAFNKRGCHSRHRAAEWKQTVVELGLMNPDFDPLRYDWISPRAAELGQSWCQRCLNERQTAWEAKRKEWWNMLDDFFVQ